MLHRPTQADIDLINDFKNDLRNEEYIKYYELAYLSFNTRFETEWCDLQRVSKNEDGELLGFIFCGINRAHDRVEDIALMNTTKEVNLTFTKDVVGFFDELRKKYRKICFDVVVGNPAEKIYDRIIKACNGNIAGIKKKHVRLTDEKFYDFKSYEIFGKGD